MKMISMLQTFLYEYCKTCSIFICEQCKINQHKNHEYEILDGLKIKSKILNIKSKLE